MSKRTTAVQQSLVTVSIFYSRPSHVPWTIKELPTSFRTLNSILILQLHLNKTLPNKLYLYTIKMGRLSNGDWLLVGNSIFSDDNGTEFRMQDDGKVAVYHGEECAWQNTAEQNWQVHGIKMQEDGNLVI